MSQRNMLTVGRVSLALHSRSGGSNDTSTSVALSGTAARKNDSRLSSIRSSTRRPLSSAQLPQQSGAPVSAAARWTIVVDRDDPELVLLGRLGFLDIGIGTISTSHRRWRISPLAAAIALSAVVLSACSGDDEPRHPVLGVEE